MEYKYVWAVTTQTIVDGAEKTGKKLTDLLTFNVTSYDEMMKELFGEDEVPEELVNILQNPAPDTLSTLGGFASGQVIAFMRQKMVGTNVVLDGDNKPN